VAFALAAVTRPAATGRLDPGPAVQAGPRPGRREGRADAVADLVAGPAGGLGMLLVAALAAALLGGLHALEPGHGKAVVAAYLVGARGTARHALLLGLAVTASHTAGVYLLGGVTLYASRHVVPERLYPWLGVLSGLMIAGLGFLLLLRRYAGAHVHAHGDDHGAHGPVSLRELVALGVGGGIVPCPGALVVLLSAVALGRIGFGLFLIAAFSLGLAAVLVAIGLLMVYARRLMANLKGGGPLVTRWLPVASSAVMAVLGVVIAVQALIAAGVVRIRLG
jgi:ABC-type nickel/cobalt efflux system permease component RcnA